MSTIITSDVFQSTCFCDLSCVIDINRCSSGCSSTYYQWAIPQNINNNTHQLTPSAEEFCVLAEASTGEFYPANSANDLRDLMMNFFLLVFIASAVINFIRIFFNFYIYKRVQSGETRGRLGFSPHFFNNTEPKGPQLTNPPVSETSNDNTSEEGEEGGGEEGGQTSGSRMKRASSAKKKNGKHKRRNESDSDEQEEDTDAQEEGSRDDSTGALSHSSFYTFWSTKHNHQDSDTRGRAQIRVGAPLFGYVAMFACALAFVVIFCTRNQGAFLHAIWSQGSSALYEVIIITSFVIAESMNGILFITGRIQYVWKRRFSTLNWAVVGLMLIPLGMNSNQIATQTFIPLAGVIILMVIFVWPHVYCFIQPSVKAYVIRRVLAERKEAGDEFSPKMEEVLMCAMLRDSMGQLPLLAILLRQQDTNPATAAIKASNANLFNTVQNNVIQSGLSFIDGNSHFAWNVIEHEFKPDKADANSKLIQAIATRYTEVDASIDDIFTNISCLGMLSAFLCLLSVITTGTSYPMAIPFTAMMYRSDYLSPTFFILPTILLISFVEIFWFFTMLMCSCYWKNYHSIYLNLQKEERLGTTYGRERGGIHTKSAAFAVRGMKLSHMPQRHLDKK